MPKIRRAVLIALCGSNFAFGGNVTVFVVQPDAASGVTEIPVDAKTSAEIETALKKGEIYVLDTDEGSVAVKAKFREIDYVGAPLEPTPPN